MDLKQKALKSLKSSFYPLSHLVGFYANHKKKTWLCQSEQVVV